MARMDRDRALIQAHDLADISELLAVRCAKCNHTYGAHTREDKGPCSAPCICKRFEWADGIELDDFGEVIDPCPGVDGGW